MTAGSGGGEQATGAQGALRDELFDSCRWAWIMVSALEYVGTCNAGTQLDQLTARQPSRDAAFMGVPEVKDPPIDQLSALRPVYASTCRRAE